jgi:hypothetical protein
MTGLLRNTRNTACCGGQPFSIAVKSKFGHAPSKEEMPDEELSAFCNGVLLQEMEALSLLPRAVKAATRHEKELHRYAQTGQLAEYTLQGDGE